MKEAAPIEKPVQRASTSASYSRDRVALESISTRKRIALISNKLYHYRVSIYNYLSQRLAGHGYELIVISDEVQIDNPHEIGFTLHQIPFSASKYKRLLSDLDPEVVILFLHIRDLVVWPLLLWLKRRGTKVIYWNHGINLETPNNLLKRFLFSIFHASADAILLYSNNEKKYIANKHHKKVFVANNTLNFDDFPEIPDSRDRLKEDLGIPFDRVALFVGRVTPSKRLDDLLDAAQFLNPGFGVVVVGGGLSDQQRKRIDIAENVIYVGEVYETEKINRIFKMADVFSIPGKMGLGINQAFYWGLPVVTEKVHHSPEIVYLKEGVNGYIVERGDCRALADKLNLLMASPDTLSAFSNAARREIMNNASIDRMCGGFLEAINACATAT